jgi:hypothetical protein
LTQHALTGWGGDRDDFRDAPRGEDIVSLNSMDARTLAVEELT